MCQERRDARLQRQAEFIDQFRAGGRIWDNVIIVAKQPGSFNLERAVQGAREAAKLLPGNELRCGHWTLQYLEEYRQYLEWYRQYLE